MKKRMQQLLTTLLVTALVLTPMADHAILAYADEENSQAAVVEAENEQETITEEPMVEDAAAGVSCGYIELPIDNNAPALVDDPYGIELLTADTIPNSYHSTLSELTTAYPGTRNQNPYGTCWAHATIACMEFDLIQDGVSSKSIDLSELQLAYFTYYLAQEPLGGFVGASSTCTASDGFLDVGGNVSYAIRRLEQWCGGANDSGALAYSNAGTVKSNLDSAGTGLASTYAYDSTTVFLTDAYMINMDGDGDGCKDSDDVKRAIMEHGAVAISYYHKDSYVKWYNSTYDGVDYGGSYYYPYDTSTNHAITVVGWDDTIPAEIFQYTPPGDGAWLCRNSWSTYTGMSAYSYFWLSYYDASLNKTAYAMDCTLGSEYDNNYQYDSGVGAAQRGGTYVANVFTTQNKAGVEAEELKAVSFSISQNSNVTYKIQIYTDVDISGNDPTNGTLQASATTTGVTTYAGYYTIPLEDSVFLEPGTTYSVVVRVTPPTGQDAYGIDLEYGFNYSGWMTETVSIHPDESFVYYSYNQGWTDEYEYTEAYPSQKGRYGNFCIKAFTSDITTGTHFLATPKNVKATRVSDTAAKLTWNAVTNAVGYEIESYNSSTGTWSKIASTTGLTYQATVGAATSYKYRIRAYAKDGATTYYSDYSAECTYSQNQTYTITYVLNGGTNAASNPASYTATTATITLASPTKSGYNFGGWYKTSNFSDSKVTQIPQGSTGNLTLYAKWSCAHTSTITTGYQAATCTQGGYSGDKICSKCYQVISYGSYIPPKGHQNTYVYNKRDATCGTSGYTGDIYCRDCYQRISYGSTIPATGNHTWNSGTVIYPATTTTTGLMQYSCTTCGATRTQTVEQLPIPQISVTYRTHVQDYGWQGYVSNGTMSGTSGQSKRLEGINISVSGNSNVGIRYTTHVQDYGWMGTSYDGAMSGTSGQSKRLEAIMIELYGSDAGLYDVYYRVHAQDYGWLGWAKNGEAAGTAGYSKRLEGIQIVVVRKGESFDTQIQGIVSKVSSPYVSSTSAVPSISGGSSSSSSSSSSSYSYSSSSSSYSYSYSSSSTSSSAIVSYQTHVQDYGWQNYVSNGSMSGTQGQSKRLEGIRINLSGQPYSGNVRYTTHVQDYGWQGDVNNSATWKKNNEMAGTSGESKRLEAICICLDGQMAQHYDIYYRVHAQNVGWMGWAKNGQMAGTAGYSYRLEGIQIVLVPKGGAAPGSTQNAFQQK